MENIDLSKSDDFLIYHNDTYMIHKKTNSYTKLLTTQQKYKFNFLTTTQNNNFKSVVVQIIKQITRKYKHKRLNKIHNVVTDEVIKNISFDYDNNFIYLTTQQKKINLNYSIEDNIIKLLHKNLFL